MSRSLAPALVTRHDIMEFTLDGEPCDPRGRTPFIERHLHAGIYRTRPDVMADRARTFRRGDSVRPRRDADARDVSQRGVPRRGRSGVRHPRASSARPTSSSATRSEGAALAEALGDKSVLLLRAHGFVAVAPEPPVRGLPRDLHRGERARSAAGRRARRTDRRARRGGRPQGGRDQPRDRRPLVGALEERGSERTANETAARRRHPDARARRATSTTTATAARGATPAASTSTPARRSAARSPWTTSSRSISTGNLVEGTARPPLEYHIHAEVYRARPDVNAVMHTHPQWSTFLTMTGRASISRCTRRACCSATSR